MNSKSFVFFVTAVLTIWNAGLIWMTQVICYPLWPLVGSADFHRYHLAWWHSIWWTFIPAGLAVIGSIFLLFRRPRYFPRWGALVVVLAQCVTLLATIAYWAPLQAGLSTANGLDMSGFRALMWTHWFRVALIWLAAAVMTQSLARQFSQAPE